MISKEHQLCNKVTQSFCIEEVTEYDINFNSPVSGRKENKYYNYKFWKFTQERIIVNQRFKKLQVWQFFTSGM